ncbi:hypothetical protein CFE70_009776 [Pyrenophora teres f. teres 0-1]
MDSDAISEADWEAKATETATEDRNRKLSVAFQGKIAHFRNGGWNNAKKIGQVRRKTWRSFPRLNVCFHLDCASLAVDDMQVAYF